MQLAATIAVVCLSAGYLLRVAWRMFTRKKSGCGSGCGKCATTATPEEKGRYSLPQV